MDAAAGADIKARHLHDPHRPGQGPLGPIGDLLQLLGTGGPDVQGGVFPDGLIGLSLDFRQLFRRDHGVKIDDNAGLIHVEARIVAAVQPVENAGDDVLPRVLLHSDEPCLIIDLSIHGAAHGQGAVAQVDDFLPLLPGIQHPDAA